MMEKGKRKTIERTFGNKTYVLPEKIPYQHLKWFVKMSAKENFDQTAILEGLMMRVVIEPPITPAYFADDGDADLDDFSLMQALAMDIATTPTRPSISPASGSSVRCTCPIAR
jgi:hypothetical protein